MLRSMTFGKGAAVVATHRSDASALLREGTPHLRLRAADFIRESRLRVPRVLNFGGGGASCSPLLLWAGGVLVRAEPVDGRRRAKIWGAEVARRRVSDSRAAWFCLLN
jgi:hypothetical protein